jgi:hypothetical protein
MYEIVTSLGSSSECQQSKHEAKVSHTNIPSRLHDTDTGAYVVQIDWPDLSLGSRGRGDRKGGERDFEGFVPVKIAAFEGSHGSTSCNGWLGSEPTCAKVMRITLLH